jgi:hypothetical protein
VEFKKFNEIAELVGIAAIVASLIFVGLEMRQSQKIALAEVEASFVSASVEIESLISSNSKVWTRGIADEELDDSDAAIFESILVALSNRNWSLQHQMRLLDKHENADASVHEFAAYLYRRPGLRRAWAEREATLKTDRELLTPWTDSFTSPYVEMIFADLSILDQKEK